MNQRKRIRSSKDYKPGTRVKAVAGQIMCKKGNGKEVSAEWDFGKSPFGIVRKVYRIKHSGPFFIEVEPDKEAGFGLFHFRATEFIPLMTVDELIVDYNARASAAGPKAKGKK